MVDDSFKIKRVRLKRNLSDLTVIPEGPVEIVVQGFGSFLGKIVVGQVVGINTRAITVSLRDEDGSWTEKYQRVSGIRVDDIGDLDGWKISLEALDLALLEVSKDLDAKKEEKELPKLEIALLSTEEIPYPGDPTDSMIVEVWEDKTNEIKYLKAFRTGPVGPGALKKAKVLPCVIPFSVLKQVLYDFEPDKDFE